jgi:hypothetical protein
MKHKRNRKHRRNHMDNNTKEIVEKVGTTVKTVTLCAISILAKSVKFLAEQVDNACSKNGRN